MREYVIPLLAALAILVLSGCAGLEDPGPTAYTMPEESVSEDEVITEVTNIVERLAAEEHVVPELSDDFASAYLDMDSFEELKERTKEGIAVTKEEAEMTEQEIRLWHEIIRNKQFSRYTVDDLQAKLDELTGILESLAQEKGESVQQYIEENFGMSEQETEEFLKHQAEKYLHSEY